MPGRILPETSRWLREGAPARLLPFRLRAGIERWSATRAYPPVRGGRPLHGGGPLRDGSLVVATGDARRPATPVARALDASSGCATMLFGGDVALHRWPLDQDPAELLSGLEPVFNSCDARVFNLESQITSHAEPAGKVGYFLRADPAALDVIDYLDPTVVTCANNHCLDFGADALAQSIDTLSARGVMVTGCERDGLDPAAIVALNGVRVGMLAYTDDWHVAAQDVSADGRGSPASARLPARPIPHEPARVRQDIATMRARADVVAVQLHWGYEWTTSPILTLRDLARSYVEAGADIVVCHHAHVPRAVETWHGGLIAHGLGNLYFGSPRWGSNPFRSRSFVLRVRVCGEGVVDAEVVPIHTDQAGRARASEGQDRDATMRALSYLSRRIGRDSYLARIERDLLLNHACTMMHDLAQRLAAGDEAAARERVRLLAPPRQRWLLRRLEETRGLAREIGEIGNTLHALHEAPDRLAEPATRQAIASLGERAATWLDRRVPVGRLP